MLRKFIVSIIVIAIASIVCFPYGYYKNNILNFIQTQGKIAGISINTHDVNIKFPGTLKFKNTNLIIPTTAVPVPISINKAEFKPKFLPLLWLTAALNGTIEAYNGTIALSASKGLLADESSINIHANNIDLALHPILGFYGASGILSFIADSNLSIGNTRSVLPSESNATMWIQNGRINAGNKIQGLISIPEVENISLYMKAKQSKNQLEIEKVRLTSSLGNAVGNGRILVTDSGFKGAMKLSFLLKLTEYGVKELGGYLALGSKIPLETKVQSWHIRIIKEPGLSPNIEIIPTS